MVGWRHQLNGHEFEQALGVGDGLRGLVGCRPWGHTDSDTTETTSQQQQQQQQQQQKQCIDIKRV